MEQFNFRDEKLRQIIEFIELHPKQFTVGEIAEKFNVSYDKVSAGIRRAQRLYKLEIKREQRGKPITPKKQVEEYIPPPPDTTNVGIIGDTHFPFTHQEYLEFASKTFDKYDVTHVIHIGDVIDSHAWSYHEHDPDGMSAGDEFEEAREMAGLWNETFPEMDVILGNHDRLALRKAFSGGLPRALIMDMKDALGTPRWNFIPRAVYDGVQYIHGEGATARTRARKDLISTVQGHRHPEAYTEHIVGENFKIFGMQVGCGVDRKAYAFGYAKDHPKPALGVGLVLNHGKLAFNVLMEL